METTNGTAQAFPAFHSWYSLPHRDVHSVIKILSCQIIASSPIGGFSATISISISSLIVCHPSTRGTAVPGHFSFSKYGTLNHFPDFPLLQGEDHKKTNLGSLTSVHEAIQTNSILKHRGCIETNWYQPREKEIKRLNGFGDFNEKWIR